MLSFIWPTLLWGLLALPLLALLYLRLLRRGSEYPVTYSMTSTLRDALARARKRRHTAALLLLLGLGAVILALARPVALLPVPADRAAIILTIDISGSMRSQDVLPNRLDAAKTAAEAFLDAVPDRVRIGLVVFAGFASLLSPPTTDHAHIRDLMSGLSTARRTAIGEGLLEAVAALPGRSRPTAEGFLPPSGGYPPGIVVLLSDGRSNTGIDPLEAADVAKRQEVKVYTVGMGRPVTPDNLWTIGGPLDEETLQTIATITGGTYQHASTARALHNIYRTLGRQLGWERRPTEVAAAAATLAVALFTGAAVFSWMIAHPLRP